MRKAFTLIELMVSIAIIAILTGTAVVSYQGVRERARDAERQNALLNLKLNLTSYYQAQIPQRYPISTTKVTLNNTNDVLWTALVPAFAKAIPLDPRNTGVYVYKYQTNTTGTTGTDYTLFGTLENTNNKKGWGAGTAWVADGYQVKPD